MSPVLAQEKLIVALDFPNAEAAARLAEKLRGRVGLFKVGSELFAAEGPVLARYLIAYGEKVFLDLKFHDIPNTVRAAAREAAQMGVAMFNVHALGGHAMMQAELVVRLARRAQRAGLDGVVASPREVAAVRRACGPAFIVVTPGIRPIDSGLAVASDDQARVATPEGAIGAGADYLVVGRPITSAADPQAAVDAILREMQKVLAASPATVQGR